MGNGETGKWNGNAQDSSGVRALATSGRAPPVQCIFHIVALLIANRALNGLEIERRSIAMYNTELRVSYAIIRASQFVVTYTLLRYMATPRNYRTDRTQRHRHSNAIEIYGR